MIISALRQQVKNPERISIFIDGKYSFSLSLSELAEYKLKAGDELSDADVKKYKKLSEDGKTTSRALAWVLNRPHSIREFRGYLRRKEVDIELAQKLEADFLYRNYLNDGRYAQWLVELRSRAGKSNRAIRSELFAKGVDREVADEALSTEAEDEANRLHELVNKKKNLSRYKNDQQKFTQYLLSKGFSYQQVLAELKINRPL